MTTSQTEDTFLTSTEAGALLNVSGRTVNRRADAGKIPVAHRLPGSNGAYLYRRADIAALASEITEPAGASR